jgi:hypothetical protein
VTPETSPEGDFILKTPPSLKHIFSLPILAPINELNPETQTLYSIAPE